MSLREGTRGKKISVLHMLGTWEGKIEGCNCPSCKECDAGEKNLALTSKSPSKVLKSLKGSKPLTKKVSIKVKTTKVIVDNNKEECISGKKVSPKKHILSKVATIIKNAKPEVTSFKTVEDSNIFDTVDHTSDREDFEGMKAISDDCINSNIAAAPSDCNNFEIDPTYVCDTAVDIEETKGENAEEIVGRERVVKAEIGERVECSSQSDSNSNVKADNFAKWNVKPFLEANTVSRQEDKEDRVFVESVNIKQELVESFKIKQEPEEYFSDEEEVEKNARGKHQLDVKNESRISKRARMVTSEIENIYAKPRMIFTGRGVVRKFEPGIDRTPKSKRGRKSNKPAVPVKVKQEPKDVEENEEEESELDQLQRALSEAAESISDVGEELLDALHEFGEEPKKPKPKKKNEHPIQTG